VKRSVFQWISDEKEIFRMILVAMVFAALLIALMINSAHNLDESFKDVRFRGLYKNAPGDYLVLYEKDGEVAGKGFFDINDAKAFVEALR